MPLILGAAGNDVLAWKGTTELLESIKAAFAEKSSVVPYGEGTMLLHRFRQAIGEEIAFEERFASEFDAVVGELEKLELDDELHRFNERLRDLAARYFERRSSVVALHGICTASLELLLKKIVQLSEYALQQEAGSPSSSFSWFLAGEGGRREQTLSSSLQLVLIYQDPADAAYFDGLCYRVTAMLKKAGMIVGSERDFLRTSFWHGSKKQWQDKRRSELSGKKPGHFLHLPMLNSLGSPFRPLDDEDQELFQAVAETADLRVLVEKDAFGRELISSAGTLLQRFTATDAFEHIGRQIAVLPVALTVFGRFKLERRGRSRGTFNIRQHALDPLVMNLTLLAIKNGTPETSTIGRIHHLLEKGRLSVDMAEKAMRTFHTLVQLEMLAYLRQSDLPGYGCIDPDRLGDEETERLKQAMEVVISLQRSVLHDFIERA